MPLLNYTTKISATKTAHEVQRVLAKAGAKRLMFEYGDDAEPVAIAFEVATRFGLRQYVLPTDAAAVLRVLHRQRVERRYQVREQALRIAWRIVKDWIEAQLAIIQTEMVTLDQVLLPYMQTDHPRQAERVSMYELYAEQQQDLIESGRDIGQ
jgi:hypothetical protein